MHKLTAIALGAFAATGLAACGSDSGNGNGNDNADKKAAAPAKPATLAITTSDAGKRFAMQAPSSVKGGLVEVRFTNASKAPHEAQLVRIDGDHSAKELLDAVDTGDKPAKIPDWLHAEGGVATTQPGQSGTATSNLPAGTYYVIDTETGNDDNAPAPSRRGAIAKLTVAPGEDGTLPTTAATIKVVDDGKERYKFETSGLTSGANTVTFENASKSPDALHHVVAFPIAKGKTLADVRKAFTARNPSGPPPLDFANGTGTTVLDAGRSLVTTMTLKPGSYALLCFLNDRDDTKPHFLKGLLAKVDVS